MTWRKTKPSSQLRCATFYSKILNRKGSGTDITSDEKRTFLINPGKNKQWLGVGEAAQPEIRKKKSCFVFGGTSKVSFSWWQDSGLETFAVNSYVEFMQLLVQNTPLWTTGTTSFSFEQGTIIETARKKSTVHFLQLRGHTNYTWRVARLKIKRVAPISNPITARKMEETCLRQWNFTSKNSIQ